jgi:SnoaL-like domain
VVVRDFEQWLTRYGDAWTKGNPDAVVQLFSRDAAYYETPFDPPMRGSDAIHQYWTEGAKNAQTDVKFGATIIAVTGNTGYARWWATFRRVPSNVSVALDGVLSASFDDAMRCGEFREWWHRREDSRDL